MSAEMHPLVINQSLTKLYWLKVNPITVTLCIAGTLETAGLGMLKHLT